MARQTEVVVLLILAIAATAFADVEKPLTAADFDKIVKDSARPRQARSTCPGCCPFGWVYYGGRCFRYHNTRMDWTAAEKRCLNLGANLVSIHSENEYQLVKALIRAHDPQENPTWIGLTGCQKMNNFFWSDGTKLTFTQWNPNEPNFHSGECCGHMNWPSPYSDSKNWNDIPCDHTYPFVCAKRII